MKRFDLTARLVLTSLLVALGAGSAAASPDELYYSASQCTPFNGSHWQGGGSEGFAFLPSQGGWYNFDHDSQQALVCPVPYRRNTNNLERITVRVVVDDRHGSLFTSAFLCGKSSTGGKFCDSGTDFPRVFGVSTIELSIQPKASTRFVWIEVEVPDDDDDNNPFTSNGTSGVIGYRVIRH